jgi:hypothetical protein
MSDRPATPAKRVQVRAAARFVASQIAAGENWLVILACAAVSRHQPAQRARGLRLQPPVDGRRGAAAAAAQRQRRCGMTAATARAYPAARPSALEVFIARAEARALLWQAGVFDLHQAVDELQTVAERDGLVTLLGQDAVQQIISEAFRKVREAP